MTLKTSNSFLPIAHDKRVEVIDALRGFALLGVILANIVSFSGYGWLAEEQQTQLSHNSIDAVINFLRSVLIDTKFITIFSILFGAGFSMQLERAKAKGIDFKRYFIKRMLVFFVFAGMHAWLLWYGDILRYYALAGLSLIFLIPFSNKNLLRLSLFFIVFLTAVVFILKSTLSFEWPYPSVSDLFMVISNGSYAEVVKMNWQLDAFPFRINPQDTPLTVAATFGKIYLGYWIGRIGLFNGIENHASLLKSWFWWGLILGVFSSLAYWAITNDLFALDSLWLLWVPFVVSGGLVLHSLFYISAFIKLHGNKQTRFITKIFIPVGRMSLTNYVLQTILCIYIFYGFLPGPQLAGKLNITQSMGIGLVVFVFQLLLSSLWLKRFRQGPLEWVWRKMIY